MSGPARRRAVGILVRLVGLIGALALTTSSGPVRALDELPADRVGLESVWWHQASNRVSISGARPEIPSAYAQVVGQRVAGTPCGSGCTGTETQFTNTVIPDGTAFIVELPTDAAVTAAVVRLHAAAVMTVIAM